MTRMTTKVSIGMRWWIQLRDYLFNDAITRDDMVTLVRLTISLGNSKGSIDAISLEDVMET